MAAYWSDHPTHVGRNYTSWHDDPVTVQQTYPTSDAYYEPDQHYDDTTIWTSQQLQRYQSPPPRPQNTRYSTHRRKHHHRHRPTTPNPPPPTTTHETQLAAYAAHSLVPALQSSPNPISVLINYGHAVIPEPARAGGSSSIVYNAPGCTLAFVPTAPSITSYPAAKPTMRDGGGGNNVLLRICRGCGVLRVVYSWGLCRDCGAGRLLDGWEAGYLPGLVRQFDGAGGLLEC